MSFRDPRCILCDDKIDGHAGHRELAPGGSDSIYFWPMFAGISPENMAKHMVLTYLQFRILEFPLMNRRKAVPKCAKIIPAWEENIQQMPNCLGNPTGKPPASCQSTAARQPSVTKPCYLLGIAFFPWPN